MRTPRWTTTLLRAARALGSLTGARPRGGRPKVGTSTRTPGAPPPRATTYPGDFVGTVRTRYSPRPDGAPDPGEIVWTWVPFEEDATRGKDRPVLLVGRDGPWLLGLQLTSRDHDLDAEREARYGRYWMDIGSGPWDRQGRASEVRLDRVIRVDPGAVRREGAVLERRAFDRVAEAMARRV
ncbi:PemK-like, MazF-like toxin of type II toxin-antitoxin system [Isoptericola sp. CG 20/1183]|uniref:PemK-like, MazF-like toxin of type II toxin-antitoxin system n=1 Tax=Isoptericola halotolerans TaxID=300560 RepID=A0ABX5EFA9_9MICO|nr:MULTISPECIES: type II toxin-antitoxin system PemK/MazF family toxin [Isoptericola]MCK0117500.1 type II toxin-antitoxin system PemK/MazF family toxin [Isoptericola sp. S6320L]PRZ05081.1 PemK-like, MazF-like toxin of type II toxin-antitoxin system [Isoptericola halotolerans]PRZ05819.1 PemK-like, MazF-like toxin of type II toxin-antitoxin system [Isoptericola sp. CG 20/1183]